MNQTVIAKKKIFAEHTILKTHLLQTLQWWALGGLYVAHLSHRLSCELYQGLIINQSKVNHKVRNSFIENCIKKTGYGPYYHMDTLYLDFKTRNRSKSTINMKHYLLEFKETAENKTNWGKMLLASDDAKIKQFHWIEPKITSS